MDLEIRPVGPEEFEAFIEAHSVAFGEHPEKDAKDELERERMVFEADRALMALDAKEIVGGAMAASFRLTVPGAEVRAAGITGVGVVPTHRRRGVNSALMRRQLDDIHEVGESVTVLWASEGGIYGRYGYGLGTFACDLRLERDRAAFARPVEPRGRVHLLRKEEALEAFRGVYERVRPHRPGLVDRPGRWWEYILEDTHEVEVGFGDLWYTVYESPEGVEGYAAYRLKDHWVHGMPDGTLQLRELIAETPEATAALWSYCLGVDLMSRVVAWSEPIDTPLLHLLAEPRRMRLTIRDGMWVRLVEVPAALAARRYAAEGRVVLGVHDAFCPWNEGRYRLEGGPQGAGVAGSDAEPDLEMDVADLGAAYLGGVRFSALAAAGRVVERTPGALELADAMFATATAPWCPHVF